MTPALGLFASVILTAGSYRMEGERGTLELTEHALNSFKFKIETLGANGHSCGVSGIIEPGLGVAKVEDGTPEKPCEVKFSSSGENIEVTYDTGNETCRSFCGMRATFDGTFTRSNPACLPQAVSETRNEFKKAYDRKDYKQAKQLLAPLHAACEKNLLWFDEQRMRNDLAITQFHLGDFSGCLTTLKPLAALANMNDQEILGDKPPFEAEQDIKTARATRTNLKKCAAKVKK